ncbi:nitroreductase family protein [Dethiothermospora halolimnae]|uniref:nitroreductase family protein n=1 Tax=Dethiothermospora halolimnae TaxID=3114390 RepID=UPI003CCBED08
MKEIFNRRSIRKYKDKKVEKEKIERMLRAAMQAPSAVNQQPWEFIVVENKETLKKLSQISPYSKMVENAPVAFVILFRKEGIPVPSMIQQDMGAATQNLLLEATHLGLGAVWLGVYPVQDRMDSIRSLLEIPDNLESFAVVPVGYPDGQENKFVDRFDESRVHYEGWK